MLTLSLAEVGQGEGYRSPVELDGQVYILELRLNTRADRWMLRIFDADENPLATGLRLVPRVNLLDGLVLEILPPGELRVTHSAGLSYVDADAWRQGRAVLVYFEADELEVLDLAASILSTRRKVVVA